MLDVSRTNPPSAPPPQIEGKPWRSVKSDLTTSVFKTDDFAAQAANKPSALFDNRWIGDFTSGFNQTVFRQSRDVRRANNRCPAEDEYLRVKIRDAIDAYSALDEMHDRMRGYQTLTNGGFIEFRDEDVCGA
jgi:hypothetical protein